MSTQTDFTPQTLMLRHVAMAIAVALAAVMLVACGTTTKDRALSGAGIGAGIGAVGGALTGNTVGGALVGGAAGAAAGGLTDPDQINLGKPAWEK